MTLAEIIRAQLAAGRPLRVTLPLLEALDEADASDAARYRRIIATARHFLREDMETHARIVLDGNGHEDGPAVDLCDPQSVAVLVGYAEERGARWALAHHAPDAHPYDEARRVCVDGRERESREPLRAGGEDFQDTLGNAIASVVETARAAGYADGRDHRAVIVHEVSGHGADDATWRPGETAAEAYTRAMSAAEARGRDMVTASVMATLRATQARAETADHERDAARRELAHRPTVIAHTAACRERDEARAEVERLRAELAVERSLECDASAVIREAEERGAVWALAHVAALGSAGKGGSVWRAVKDGWADAVAGGAVASYADSYRDREIEGVNRVCRHAETANAERICAEARKAGEHE